MPPGLNSPVHLLIVLVVAFVVLGPEQLPGAIRQVGRLVADVRRYSESLKAEMDNALRVGGDADATPQEEK